ncbi:MAG: ABC transporter permease [Bacteroidaceae bacterium]|nr:ABC transporter permease [Bacteroidaceae bacterium]
MKLRIDRDQWEEIFDSLSRNKTRTFLTAFGIFWGVFMLVLLMGGGQGLQSMLATNFAGFANNSGFMMANVTSEAYKGFQKGRYWNIETTDLPLIRSCVPELDIISPSLSNWGSTATFEDKKSSVSVKGEYPNASLIEDPKIRAGRGLNDVDVQQGRKVCVIGKRIVEELFKSDEKALGNKIAIDGIYYQVVGISGKSEGGISIGGNATTTVHIPYTTMQSAYNRGNRVDILCLTAREGYKMSDLQQKVEAVLKRKHLIHPDDTQAVVKVNAEAIFSMIDNLFKGVSILVWMIGLGTLFAGAIGVSNIMVVTVKERTTEIGIRRAIGATPTDILSMIMSESIVLTLIAGMSGIVFAVLILQVVENSVQAETPGAVFQITFAIAIGAALMLATLGVLAGLAPTLRAMQIKPVDAMREE